MFIICMNVRVRKNEEEWDKNQKVNLYNKKQNFQYIVYRMKYFVMPWAIKKNNFIIKETVRININIYHNPPHWQERMAHI